MNKHTEYTENIETWKRLVKENKRLQAEYRQHVADLKRLFREFRSRLPKKPKPNLGYTRRTPTDEYGKLPSLESYERQAA